MEPVIPQHADPSAHRRRRRELTDWLARAILAVASAIVIFVGSAQVLAPTVRFQLDALTIRPDGGLAFVVPDAPEVISWLHKVRVDDPADPSGSPLRFYEGDQLLGPAHSVHDDIRQHGRGRYSHWGRSLWFSSSDGTDPRSNGRVYRVEAPAIVRTRWSTAALVSLVSVAFTGLYWWLRRRVGTQETRATLEEWGAFFTRRPQLILASAAACIAFAGTAVVAEMLSPTYSFALKREGIVPEIGRAYFAEIPSVGVPYRLESDAGSDPRASTLQVFEDGKLLGPAHSIHADIRTQGEGRFSHWGSALVFSTPDNSNPAANGRYYTISADATLHTSITALAVGILCLGMVLLGGWVRIARADSWSRYRQRLVAIHRDLCAPLVIRVAAITGLALAGSALGVAGVVLGWFVGGGTQIGLELGRFFPVSDADGYHSCGTLLAAWGELGWEYCGRRMLYVSMLSSLFAVLGGSAQNVLIAQGVLVGVAAVVLVAQVAQAKNALAAAVTLLTAMVFAWEMTLGVFMTEVAGYVMGALSLALLLAFSEAKRPVWLFAGMAFFSIAMVARAGAMFALPLAVLWAGLVVRGDPDRAVWKHLSVAVAGAAVGPLLQFAEVWLVGLDPGNTGANFSTILYGMSTGSRRFSEAHDVFHDVFATHGETAGFRAVYAAAFQNIVTRPDVFLRSLADSLRDFWSVFFAVGPLARWSTTFRVLFFVGLWRCVVNWRSTPAAPLLLVLLLGEFAAAPLIGGSESLRVFAATIMVRWIVCGIGLAFIVDRLFVGLRSHLARTPPPTFASAVPKFAVATGLTVVALMVFPVLPFSSRLQSLPATGSCAPGLLELISPIGIDGAMITITNRPEGLESLQPFRISFARLTADPRYRAAWFSPELAALRPPVTFLRVLDRARGRVDDLWHLVYEGELAISEAPRVLCVDTSRFVSLAQTQHLVIRDVQDLPRR